MQRRSHAILATLAVIAAACGGVPPGSLPPASVANGASTPAAPTAPSRSDLAEKQVLHINLGRDPETLDPAKANDPASAAVLHGLVRGLLYVDKDFKVVPELAAAMPNISADAKTFTFHLRDAKYSNGDAIVAGDLVYSWRRLIDPRVGAESAYLMRDLTGAPSLLALAGKKPPATADEIDALLARVGVAAPDDKTFVVTLDRPATYFLSVVALPMTAPLEEKWITRPSATEAENYVGSGPFKLDSWKHDTEIVLKPNPFWYGELKPTLNEIDMSMMAEPTQAQAAYESGELDMVTAPSDDIQRIKADPVLGPQVVDIAQFGITYYAFNNATGPTANKEFRIALTQAIDKKALIEATFGGTGQQANSMIMPGIPGYQGGLDPYPYDLASARDHMNRALAGIGVAAIAELGRLKFGYNAGGNHEPKVAFLAEAWRQAFGLQTEQVRSEWNVFKAARAAGLYAISRDGWGADYPHASNQLGMFTCGGGDNDVQYCNPAFDAYLVQAAAEPEPEEQLALYDQAQTILMEDAPFLPLRFDATTSEVKQYVGGLASTGQSAHLPPDAFYETIFIKKH